VEGETKFSKSISAIVEGETNFTNSTNQPEKTAAGEEDSGNLDLKQLFLAMTEEVGPVRYERRPSIRVVPHYLS
jgi:hypothetical protein